MKKFTGIILLLVFLGACNNTPKIQTKKIDDKARAKEISDMKFGMFICWSFSTFSGQEWTPTLDKDASYFKASGRISRSRR